MGSEALKAGDKAMVSLGGHPTLYEFAEAHGRFTAELRRNGKLVWTDEFDNTWTIEGKNHALDSFFAGSAYTGAFYLGLISLVGYVAIDTGGVGGASRDTAGNLNVGAGGFNQWFEADGTTHTPQYTPSTRPQLVWNAGGAVSGAKSNSTAPAVFTMTSGGTAKGCICATISTKNTLTGKLISAGLFSGGDRLVATSDTLSVTWTASL